MISFLHLLLIGISQSIIGCMLIVMLSWMNEWMTPCYLFKNPPVERYPKLPRYEMDLMFKKRQKKERENMLVTQKGGEKKERRKEEKKREESICPRIMYPCLYSSYTRWTMDNEHWSSHLSDVAEIAYCNNQASYLQDPGQRVMAMVNNHLHIIVWQINSATTYQCPPGGRKRYVADPPSTGRYNRARRGSVEHRWIDLVSFRVS